MMYVPVLTSRFCVVVAALLAVLIPVAQAAEVPASAVVTIKSPSLVEIVTQASYDGNQAASFRTRLDSNGDGTVNATEVEKAETAFVDSIRSHGLSLGPPGGRMLMDNGIPTYVLAREVQFIGVEGAVSSPSGASSRITYHVGFSQKNESTHELRVDPKARNSAGRYLENITEATILVAPGFLLNEESWLPGGARMSADRREVSMPGGLNPAVDPFWLRFEEDPETGASASSIPFQLAAAVVLLVGWLGSQGVVPQGRRLR